MTKDRTEAANKLIDKLVWRICNILINEVASDEYRKYLTAVIWLGRAEVRKIAEQRAKEKKET